MDNTVRCVESKEWLCQWPIDTGEEDNTLSVTVQVATPVPTRNGAGFRIPRTESGTRKQGTNSNCKFSIVCAFVSLAQTWHAMLSYII